jgi:ParB family chromosome partitioning protein
VALVENLQRQDLNALEEAIAYRKLMEEYDHTQENLAQAIGKSRSHIANTLRLLTLPERVKNMLMSDMLSAGHARALINARDPDALATLVVNKGYSVRQTERLAQETKVARAGRRAKREKDANTLAIERDLSSLLGLRVSVNFRGGGGELVIHYSTLERLDDVLQRLRQGAARPPVS